MARGVTTSQNAGPTKVAKVREAGKHDTVISRVLVLNTGGTIGMFDRGRGLEPVPGVLDGFLRKLHMFHDAEFYDPSLHGPGLITGVSKHGRRCYYEIVDSDPVLDSSDMNMKDWSLIAESIAKAYKDWDGFVVLHGTDTMAYTTSALSFMLKNLGKPVVVTGSQVPLSFQRNDGQANLQGALLVASHYVIPEVTLFFDNKLLRGNRASKVHASALAAFDSPNIAPLLTFGIDVHVAWDTIVPAGAGPFDVTLRMDPNVAVLRLFPGITASTIGAICKAPVKGVVLQSYGAGNCPENEEVLSAFKKATSSGVLILNLTQCQGGYVSDAYRAGKILLDAGVVAGGDMTPEAALAKMSWVLGQEGLSYQQRVDLLSHNIRGERSVIGKSRFSMSDSSFIRELASALRINSAIELTTLKDALSPMMLCAAAATGDVALVKDFCDDGLNINSADYDGRTPMHIAASHGAVEIVQHLLAVGASVHATDRFGYTPLRDALEKGHTDVCELLLAAGAELKMTTIDLGVTLCTVVANGDKNRLIQWLRAGADVNATDYDMRTPLHIACANNQIDIAELLLAQPGIDPDVIDVFGHTPLAESEIRKYCDMATLVRRSSSPTIDPSEQ